MEVLKVLWLPVLCIGMLLSSPASSDVQFGETIVIESDRTVDQAVSIGSDVRVYGTIKSDAVAILGDVIVESGGNVNGETVAIGGDIIVNANGTVHRDAVSLGGRIKVRPGGIVKGERIQPFFVVPKELINDIPGTVNGIISAISKSVIMGPFIGILGMAGVVIGLVFFLLKLTIWIVAAVLVTYFFPENVSRMADCAKYDLLKSFLVGIVIYILIPVVMIFFAITIIGLPLIPLALVLLFFVKLFGAVGIALWAGRVIPNSEQRTIMVNVLLGILAIGAIKLVPVLGFLLGIFVGVVALGVVIITRLGKMSYRSA